jgi:hypothetical protein
VRFVALRIDTGATANDQPGAAAFTGGAADTGDAALPGGASAPAHAAIGGIRLWIDATAVAHRLRHRAGRCGSATHGTLRRPAARRKAAGTANGG